MKRIWYIQERSVHVTRRGRGRDGEFGRVLHRDDRVIHGCLITWFMLMRRVGSTASIFFRRSCRSIESIRKSPKCQHPHALSGTSCDAALVMEWFSKPTSVNVIRHREWECCSRSPRPPVGPSAVGFHEFLWQISLDHGVQGES